MSSAVAIRSFPARDGKPATHFREQTAAVLRDGDFPLPFTISLDEDQAPYG
ncbi:single-stranded DNA-binding protein, partial [Xanthomonas perforans]